MRQFKHFIFSLFALGFLFVVFTPIAVKAQELIQDKTEVVKAEVIEVLSQTEEAILDTGIESISQTIKIKILEDDQSSEVVTIEKVLGGIARNSSKFINIKDHSLELFLLCNNCVA